MHFFPDIFGKQKVQKNGIYFGIQIFVTL